MGTTGGHRPGRRTVLAASLGAVIGGGAGSAITAAADSSSNTGPHQPSPGEQLMVEHGVLKRIVLSYRTIASDLAAEKPVAETTVTGAAQIVADYVESFHEGLEEAYVFPRVRAEHSQLVDTLLEQHDRGRHLTAAIISTASNGLGSAAARRELGQLLSSFIRMYEPHEAWEDTIIYPALQAATDQQTLNRLAARFVQLAVAQYGPDPLTTVLGRVGTIETALGIHDLASFTPPSDAVS